MEDGTRESILDWLKDRGDSWITLGARGTTLKVTGVCQGVDELDACSTEFSECLISVGMAGVEVSLTFHEANLALQVLLRPETASRPSVSLPLSIGYGDVVLGDADRPGEEDELSRRRGELRTPYRLLHQEP